MSMRKFLGRPLPGSAAPVTAALARTSAPADIIGDVLRRMKRAPKKLSGAQLTSVSRLFGVLSEPSRLLLLQALHDGPLAVHELMKACAMKQANASKHLAVLRDHHLVERRREGPTVQYRIADPMVFALCDLVCGKMKRDAECLAALFHPEI